MSAFNTNLENTCCFINGQWVAPISGELIKLTDPSDGSDVCSIARGQKEDIDLAVSAV